MALVIDTPLLIVGGGPAALVVAKVVSGYGLGSVVTGHQSVGSTGDEAAGGGGGAGAEPSAELDDRPVELGDEAVAVLTPHGVLDVLRPYLSTADPPAIVPSVFVEVLKHHCVADMNVTVYDGLVLTERERRAGRAEGLVGVLSDGRSRWEVRADAFVDASTLPADLPGAVVRGAEVAREIVAALTA
jgi:hypothetical protein